MSTFRFSSSAKVIELNPTGARAINERIVKSSKFNLKILYISMDTAIPMIALIKMVKFTNLKSLNLRLILRPMDISMIGDTVAASEDIISAGMLGSFKFSELKTRASKVVYITGDLKILLSINDLLGFLLPALQANAYTTLKTIRALKPSATANLANP